MVKILVFLLSCLMFTQLNAQHNQIFQNSQGKYGLKKADGTEILPAEYDEMNTFFRNYYRVRKGVKWGMYNSRGEEVVPIMYDLIYGLRAKKILLRLNDKLGMIDFDGNQILEVKYEDIYSIDGEFIHIKINGLLGLLDFEGNEVFRPVYDEIIYESYYGSFTDNQVSDYRSYFIVQKDNKWGILHEPSKEVFIPLIYEKLHYYSRRFIAVQLNHKWIILNLDGKKINDFEYDKYELSKELFVVVEREGKTFYLDKEGAEHPIIE